MTTAQQVIDDIDALVDEQMAGGETGYDYDDPDYPRCRCGCMWHGLRKGGCPGSDSEGPLMVTGLRFGNWASEMVLPSRDRDRFDPADSIAVSEGLEQITAAFRVVSTGVSRVWESIRRTLLGLPHPQLPSRCTLAARRRMHSDQLRVQRRAARRERRARRREAKCDRLEVHDDHVVLTLIPDVSGFRRELRRTYDPS